MTIGTLLTEAGLATRAARSAARDGGSVTSISEATSGSGVTPRDGFDREVVPECTRAKPSFHN